MIYQHLKKIILILLILFDNKTKQASYPIFNFNISTIIPSLYNNSIYSINIFSFVNKNLKVEIINENTKPDEFLKSFLVSSYIPVSNPIVISFIIPEKNWRRNNKNKSKFKNYYCKSRRSKSFNNKN